MEYRVIGPPGTGKTTYLVRQIEEARRKRGADSVMVLSLTRAAATEIASRAGVVRRADGARTVGTLHSVCYHLLGRPKIADVNAQEWNEKFKRVPEWQIARSGGDHYGVRESLFEKSKIYRARRIPLEQWMDSKTADFEKAWSAWKQKNNMLDFTDMIEICLRDNVRVPSGIQVIFVDEAQDLTKLQLDLIRQWAQSVDVSIFAYDDDQAIFHFTGASVEYLIGEPIPEANRRVLSQSYRVPISVHAYAQRLVSGLTVREPKEYKPRPELGICEAVPFEWDGGGPAYVCRQAEEAEGTKRTTMVLASCSYMLKPTLELLRRRGIPFHNPYRKNDGSFNPLSSAAGSTGNRLLTFMKRNVELSGEGMAQLHVWKASEVWAWAEHLRAEVFHHRGAKTELKQIAEEEPDKLLLESPFFSEAAMPYIDAGDHRWWMDHLVSKRANESAAYVAAMMAKDPKSLFKTPQLIVGTVHSVKGGESDHVIVYPDVSYAVRKQWGLRAGRQLREDTYRLFYVAATRAREHLTVGANSPKSGPCLIPRPPLCAGLCNYDDLLHASPRQV